MALFNAPKKPESAPASKPASKGKKEYPADVPMNDGGPYPATVVFSRPKISRTEKRGFMLKWQDENGRSAWQNIWVSPASEASMDILYKQMAVFGIEQADLAAYVAEITTTGVDSELVEEMSGEIAAAMMGTEALVSVKTKAYDGKYFTNVTWLDEA